MGLAEQALTPTQPFPPRSSRLYASFASHGALFGHHILDPSGLPYDSDIQVLDADGQDVTHRRIIRAQSKKDGYPGDFVRAQFVEVRKCQRVKVEYIIDESKFNSTVTEADGDPDHLGLPCHRIAGRGWTPYGFVGGVVVCDVDSLWDGLGNPDRWVLEGHPGFYDAAYHAYGRVHGEMAWCKFDRASNQWGVPQLGFQLAEGWEVHSKEGVSRSDGHGVLVWNKAAKAAKNDVDFFMWHGFLFETGRAQFTVLE